MMAIIPALKRWAMITGKDKQTRTLNAEHRTRKKPAYVSCRRHACHSNLISQKRAYFLELVRLGAGGGSAAEDLSVARAWRASSESLLIA